MNSFTTEYRNIFGSEIKEKGTFYLSESFAHFLYELCSEFMGKQILVPHLLNGELVACVRNSLLFSKKLIVSEQFESLMNRNCNKYNNSDFLDFNFKDKYDGILLFPPFGVIEKNKKSEVLYLKKSLELLNENGRLIAILPQSILVLEKYKELRYFIIANYSINSVISLNPKMNVLGTRVSLSIIIIDKKVQTNKIFMSDRGFNDLEVKDWYRCIKKGSNGYFVDSNDVYNRLDANYYNPEYNKARLLIQNKNTEKLEKHADIFLGLHVPACERKELGDYLIIKPQYIYDNIVHFGNNKKYYCSKEYVDSVTNGSFALLQKGDILISTTGKINWAIYKEESNIPVIANSNIAIIRPKNNSSQKLINCFFSSNTGIEYFENQVSFLTHCGVYNNDFISRVFGLRNISIPNIITLKSITRIASETELKETLAIQFQNAGWDVKQEYLCQNTSYDMSLFSNGIMKAVVQFKYYKSSEFNKGLELQLNRIKKNWPNIHLFVFVDEGLYEYKNEKLVQVSEFPRPDNISTISAIDYPFDEKSKITKNEGYSISDSFKIELLLKQIDELNKKVETGFYGVNEKLDSIIEKLNNVLRNYQQLVNRQLNLVDSNIEEEHIIHAFSEEISEKMLTDIQEKGADELYNNELNKLKKTFGDTWNKLDEKSKSFLISSKIIFNELQCHDKIIDYSGVCLLVTKALELELSNRFCKEFILYLKNQYPGKENYKVFPSVLLDRFGKPISSSRFTLGSVAHLFCYYPIDKTKIKDYCVENTITEEQFKNNKEKLYEFCINFLFLNKDKKYIANLIKDFAEDIEEVKTKYRNKAAHTNELRKVDAEECFEFVVDIEKLLKRMLDSFIK